jgi:hypothetical protein
MRFSSGKDLFEAANGVILSEKEAVVSMQMDRGAEHSPTREEIETQLTSVLASRHFRQARSLEKFLTFVVNRSLAGETDRLKELSIGIEVFQRASDFDPRIDTVVRVQAANLRRKLSEYYLEEGLGDRVLIDLPKGHYVPTFQYRPLQNGLPPGTPTSSLEEGEAPLIPDEEPRRRAIPIRVLLLCAMGGLILGVLVTLGFVAGRNYTSATSLVAGTPHPDPAVLPIWENFLTPDAHNLLAYGVPQFFSSNGMIIRDVLVNSSEELQSGPGARLARVARGLGISLRPTEIYTGVGEAHGINIVSRFFWENSFNLQIARSRIVGWQDLKNTNLIFLSSLRFHTLIDGLGYPTDFQIPRDNQRSQILNLRPGPGEEKAYGPQGDHAIITLWPGKSDSRRILQLSGVTTWATLAAAEYVTDLESLRELAPHFEECRRRKGLASHPPYFQILIRAEVKDNFPISIRYVTHHDLDMTPWLNPK